MNELIARPTAYGRPASALLHARLAAAKAGDPLRPVTLVVPTNYVGVSVRRSLAGGELGPLGRGAGVAGLSLVTVYRLAELLGAPSLAAAGRRPVSTPVIAAALRGVLAEAPGVFAPVAAHAATEEALVRAYRELSELRPASLDRLAAGGPQAAEAVRVCRDARARLRDRWYGEADLMAAAAAESDRSPALAELGAVLVHLPQDLSLPAAELLRAVARRAPVEVIAGRSGDPGADADVDRSLRRLGVRAAAGAAVSPPRPTRVLSVSDPEEEARSALAEVVAAARAGTPLERMAVLYPSEEPYARLLAEQLDAAGVAWNGRTVRPLAQCALGRWLLDLLALPERRYARPAVLGLLAAAPVRGRDGSAVPAGAWERISRDAGVVRDHAEWQAKLTRLAGDARARARREADGDDPRAWLVERQRRDADDAERLRAFVDELSDCLADAGRLRGWRQLVAWARRTADRYLGDDRGRQGWPEAERAAAERVEERLDRLAVLDQLDPSADLGLFRRTLRLELDDDLGRVGELGVGVLVGRTSSAWGLDLELVVVLGLAEGVCPTRPTEDSLLPDAERRTVADELRPRGERLEVEHRQLLAALAASSGGRVLVHPRGDLRRSLERPPSRWLLDGVAELRGDGVRRLPARAPWLRTVPSFAHRVRTVSFPATRQEYGLRALAGTPPPRLPAHPLVSGDAVLRRGVELVRSRGRGFGRFDGNLGGLAGRIPSPADPDRVVSASQLEQWLTCPHAYLVGQLLRVQPVDNPEELIEIDRLARGTLVHDVLEAWLGEQLGGTLPAPGDPWSPRARRRLRELAEQACADAEASGLTGHPLLWRRDRERILADLERFVDADDSRRARLGLTPTAAEHAFGLPGSGSPPLTVDLGDGRSLRLRGRVDRIDRAADGSVVVTDYKTGSARRYARLGDEQPLGDGTRLQLPLYALAARAAEPAARRVRAEYWFTSAREGFVCVGLPLDDGLLAALQQALRLAADGIAAGLFPPRPPEPGWSPYTECRFCDPDELGTADRYRDWERVRRADALRAYVEHVEPDTLARPESA